MKAMIMAAGMGTRLMPLTRLTSKPMVPIVGRPVMEHLVRLLARHDIHEVATNLHYHPHEIRDHFRGGGRFGVELRYRFEVELSGTAGGVGLFREFLGDGTFLVVSGDALTDVDLTSLVAHHRACGGIATMGVKHVGNPSSYGVVLSDGDGRVTGFQEKPSAAEALSTLCNTGIYVFEPAIFDYIPAGRFVDFAQHVFPALLHDGTSFHVCELADYWNDVGSLMEYRRGNFDALSQRVDVQPLGETQGDGVWLGADVSVSPRAVLRPPVYLGAGSRVAGGATLLGPVVVGPSCVLDADAHLERSVLWKSCGVGPGASVVDALLGSRVLVGAGAGIGRDTVIADDCVVRPGAVVPEGTHLEPGAVAGEPSVTV